MKIPIYYINKSKNIFVSNLDTDITFKTITEKVFDTITEKSYAYLWQCWTSVGYEELLTEVYNRLKTYKHIDTTIMCNTLIDKKNLEKIGFRCVFVHHNAFLDETLFFIRNVPKKYNAICVSQIAPYKRLELAKGIKNLGIITHTNPEIESELNYVNKIYSEIGKQKILNLNKRLLPFEVANQINQAKCGLILSSVEGGNYATTEYLLCGIPVVTTDNVGGRNEFLNEKNSVFCLDNQENISTIVNNLNHLVYNRLEIRNNCVLKMYEFRDVLYNDLENRFGSDWDDEYVFINKLLKWV